jgi:hypothetical protein
MTTDRSSDEGIDQSSPGLVIGVGIHLAWNCWQCSSIVIA